MPSYKNKIISTFLNTLLIHRIKDIWISRYWLFLNTAAKTEFPFLSRFYLNMKLFLQKVFLQQVQIFIFIKNQNSEDIFLFVFLNKTHFYNSCIKQFL